MLLASIWGLCLSLYIMATSHDSRWHHMWSQWGNEFIPFLCVQPFCCHTQAVGVEIDRSSEWVCDRGIYVCVDPSTCTGASRIHQYRPGGSWRLYHSCEGYVNMHTDISLLSHTLSLRIHQISAESMYPRKHCPATTINIFISFSSIALWDDLFIQSTNTENILNLCGM